MNLLNFLHNTQKTPVVFSHFSEHKEKNMFYNNLINLCNKKNTTPTTVVKALKISAGSVTNWKNGSIPTDKTLAKLAEYFNVSIEELKNPKVKDEFSEFLSILNEKPELCKIINLLKEESKENLEKAITIIEIIKN